MRTPELTYYWLHWEVIGRLVKAHQDSTGSFLQRCLGHGVWIREAIGTEENRLLISSHHCDSQRRGTGQTQQTHTV